ncbi:hypothetical protein [Spirosoma rigui]|uniref:hypothetical protein n=1 Tax=Spirosoma rigui TaxID=564064 RepID=UPI0012D34658|nr:hypothetical protein [Spirosoma rigui]
MNTNPSAPGLFLPVQESYEAGFPAEPETHYRRVRPESVAVEANGQLRVVNKRRLYTRTSVKEMTITTRYERFTMTT